MAEGLVLECEVYDPGDDSWATVASLNVGRRGTKGYYSADLGKVYIVGGGDIDANPVDAVDVYDVDAETMAAGTALDVARSRHAIAGMTGDKLLTVAGQGASEVLDSSEERTLS